MPQLLQTRLEGSGLPHIGHSRTDCSETDPNEEIFIGAWERMDGGVVGGGAGRSERAPVFRGASGVGVGGGELEGIGGGGAGTANRSGPCVALEGGAGGSETGGEVLVGAGEGGLGVAAGLATTFSEGATVPNEGDAGRTAAGAGSGVDTTGGLEGRTGSLAAGLAGGFAGMLGGSADSPAFDSASYLSSFSVKAGRSPKGRRLRVLRGASFSLLTGGEGGTGAAALPVEDALTASAGLGGEGSLDFFVLSFLRLGGRGSRPGMSVVGVRPFQVTRQLRQVRSRLRSPPHQGQYTNISGTGVPWATTGGARVAKDKGKGGGEREV
ncbi:MAG: hypothetical protein KGJ23_12215 [Euryarchaeota archaeon]|nr:hypothetical protein [Euryarchaeota archaeon]MDE1837361.1 hypothetical protein [Euryarchaeota archaeon]MDE1881369.1 hypothetical protein [Euryarchaeota archaeon]MDE2045639.1 hypothetical protein [Thermoplasmata archaeon]